MSGEPDLVSLFKMLAHEGRIRVAAAIIPEPRSADEVADLLQISRREATQYLAMLESVELAVPEDLDGVTVYRFSRRPLVEVMRGIEEKGRAPLLDDDIGEYDRRVLMTFLPDGTLISIPAQQKKRDAVLRFLAEKFEPERMYGEREVNDILREYHPDVASLRRYLVDGGFLKRQVIRSIAAERLGSQDPPVEHTVQYWKPRREQ